MADLSAFSLCWFVGNVCSLKALRLLLFAHVNRVLTVTKKTNRVFALVKWCDRDIEMLRKFSRQLRSRYYVSYCNIQMSSHKFSSVYILLDPSHISAKIPPSIPYFPQMFYLCETTVSQSIVVFLIFRRHLFSP